MNKDQITSGIIVKFKAWWLDKIILGKVQERYGIWLMFKVGEELYHVDIHDVIEIY